MTAIFNSMKRLTAISRSPLGLAILITLALAIAGIVQTQQAFGYDQDVQKLNRFVKHLAPIRLQ